MDLADLLAREGYADTDLTRLLAWARARADALLAEADVSAPMRQLLTGHSEHVPEASPRARAVAPAEATDDETPVLASEVVAATEEDVPIDLRRAVTAATAAHPAAADDDDAESGVGGFARFGGIARMKNRPYPFREQSEPEDRPLLARSFALAAERAAEERDAPAVARGAAAPASAQAATSTASTAPSHSPELSGTLPMAALDMSAEESGGLVLGIPDDESADVPVPRASSPSAALARASGPARAAERLSTPLDDDDPDSALAGLAEASDSELLAGLTETPGAPEPSPPPPAPIASEPTGVDLSHPIAVRTREPTGPRDVHVESELPDDPQAPVLRRRTPKKKVVELGAPVARPRGSSASAQVVPRSNPASGPRKSPPPPPPPGRRPTPRHEEIEELSRVELLEDIPAYLRDDED